jgi:hypothetical protein
MVAGYPKINAYGCDECLIEHIISVAMKNRSLTNLQDTAEVSILGHDDNEGCNL